MADAVTWETLRELAGFRSETGCAFSLYLDLDPSTTPTAADAETRFRSLLDRAGKEAGNGGGEHSHAEKVALRQDLERIQEWWESEFDRDGALGFAVFASSTDSLWRVLALPGTVRDAVQLGRELRVAPLLALADGSDGLFVAAVNRERGEVYRLRAGKLVEVADRSDEVPGRHDQGGWSQARFQRHIEKLIAEHLKAVSGEIEKRMRRVSGPQLVIVCPEDLRGEIEDMLSADVREAVVGWASAEAHASPEQLLEIARPFFAHADAARIQEAVERWREERGRGGRAAAGWNETLAAASDGRVEVLLFDERDGASAYECPKCGRAEAAAGSCPLDGTHLEPADAAELAIHHTLAHGGTVVNVPAGELERAGVGALLRF